MEPTSLSTYYDDLKKDLAQPQPQGFRVGFGPGGMNPDAMAWKHKLKDHCHHLKDKCCKHLLLDIYCKILPLDHDYIHGHMGQMSSDVDGMLTQKGMTPTQYFTSCQEATGAPLVKFILNSVDTIANTYMEKEDAVLKDAQQNNIELPPPPEPDAEDPEIQSQLVDVESDMDYENFVDKLKKKTIDKIVDDVSNLIAGEKEDNSMEFDTDKGANDLENSAGAENNPGAENTNDMMEPTGESTFMAAYDYLNKKNWNQDANKEENIGLAIREATLHEFDRVFNLRGHTYQEYVTRINLGKGYVINESSRH